MAHPHADQGPFRREAGEDEGEVSERINVSRKRRKQRTKKGIEFVVYRKRKDEAYLARREKSTERSARGRAKDSLWQST